MGTRRAFNAILWALVLGWGAGAAAQNGAKNYQPHDAQGRPVGAPIAVTTSEELRWIGRLVIIGQIAQLAIGTYEKLRKVDEGTERAKRIEAEKEAARLQNEMDSREGEHDKKMAEHIANAALAEHAMSERCKALEAHIQFLTNLNARLLKEEKP